MLKTLPTSRDVALLVLRLSGLGLACLHGWGKVSNLAAGEADRFVAGVAAMGFPAPTFFAWAAGLSELVGGLCVALGLGARLGAAFAGFTMFVAAFVRHKAHLQLMAGLGLASIPDATLEAWRDPELSLLYLLAFVTIVVAGPGRYTLDSLRRKG